MTRNLDDQDGGGSFASLEAEPQAEAVDRAGRLVSRLGKCFRGYLELGMLSVFRVISGTSSLSTHKIAIYRLGLHLNRSIDRNTYRVPCLGTGTDKGLT